MADTARLQAQYWSQVEIPTWIQLFSLIFLQIHTNEFIQLLYKLCSTNSYKEITRPTGTSQIRKIPQTGGRRIRHSTTGSTTAVSEIHKNILSGHVLQEIRTDNFFPRLMHKSGSPYLQRTAICLLQEINHFCYRQEGLFHFYIWSFRENMEMKVD